MELANLKFYHLDTERGQQANGNKDRVIPIGERTPAWVKKYTGAARQQLAWIRTTGQCFFRTPTECSDWTS